MRLVNNLHQEPITLSNRLLIFWVRTLRYSHGQFYLFVFYFLEAQVKGPEMTFSPYSLSVEENTKPSLMLLEKEAQNLYFSHKTSPKTVCCSSGVITEPKNGLARNGFSLLELQFVCLTSFPCSLIPSLSIIWFIQYLYFLTSFRCFGKSESLYTQAVLYVYTF